MIKFFRKIRQQLLTENKFSKYMLYAIGEIVLVVIGILIALSINNRNENNKKRNLEIDILKEVNASLETDLVGIKENLYDLKYKYVSENIVIDWIESKTPFNDSLPKHLNRIVFGVEFNYQGAPYETLKQLGMRSIKNDSLRKQISFLYDLRYDHYNTLINYQIEVITGLQKMQYKHYDEIGFLNQNIMKPRDLVALRKDIEFLSMIKTMRNYNEYIFEIQIPQVEAEIIKTKNMIEEEVEIRSYN